MSCTNFGTTSSLARQRVDEPRDPADRARALRLEDHVVQAGEHGNAVAA
jgi:hypothetical protein